MDRSVHLPFLFGDVIFFENDTDGVLVLLKKYFFFEISFIIHQIYVFQNLLQLKYK